MERENQRGATQEVGSGENAGGETKPVQQKSERSEDDYNPMLEDFKTDIGLREGDTIVPSMGIFFKEKRTKDVPCKFHDGFSGTCWKGSTCVYGHEKYTGGRFAKKYPMLALAAGARREVTAVTRLPSKPLLHNEREIVCRVAHVTSPSEFFIRPTKDGIVCPCQIFNRMVNEMEAKAKTETGPELDPMERYYFGFTGLDDPEIATECESLDINVPEHMEAKLQSLLNSALHYKKLQCPIYMPKMELVAVCVNKTWMRAIVLCSPVNMNAQIEELEIRVQLLDTGEKVTANLKDVCRLPRQFAGYHALVFRCALFRVSPVWFIWSKSAVKFFKDLVENKDLRVIVKDAQQKCTSNTFESVPYIVKIMIDEKGDGEWTDVSQKLIDEGYGLEWNMMPYRPFARQVIKTDGFDFLYTPIPAKLPPSALELENKRLNWDNEDGNDDESIDVASGFGISSDLCPKVEDWFRSGFMDNIEPEQEENFITQDPPQGESVI